MQQPEEEDKKKTKTRHRRVIKRKSEPFTFKKRYYYATVSPQFKQIMCSNCNGKGHFFKDCKKPITSFGLLGWTLRPTTNEGVEGLKAAFSRISCTNITFLDQLRTLYRTGHYQLNVCLIQRRNTISFEAFVRGKYSTVTELQLHKERMTNDEKYMILTKTWDELYAIVMADKDIKHIEKEKKKAKIMFETLNVKELFQIDDVPKPTFHEPSWEIPKGRRYSHEKDLQCALREFEEETNIPSQDVVIFNEDHWCIEEFCGMNLKTYCNKYFVGFIHPLTIGPFIDEKNANQTAEVRNVAWFSFEQALATIHDYSIEKKKALITSYEQVSAFLNLL